MRHARSCIGRLFQDGKLVAKLLECESKWKGRNFLAAIILVQLQIDVKNIIKRVRECRL
jgi:hypothetical protein